jgi:hypothetical protein
MRPWQTELWGSFALAMEEAGLRERTAILISPLFSQGVF